jgi:hypothetical protein
MMMTKLSPPKTIWIDALILFILALIVRWLAALPQQQPNYMDAAYYYVNALNLWQGRGFVEDFIWTYLGNPATVPHPSHLYWMPFTSILAWLGMIIGGDAYRAAQIMFVILSALLAPITYIVTCIVSRQRWPGWIAGLLAIFSGFYFPYWTAIDNFTPFAVTGSLALLLAWAAIATEQLTINNESNDNKQPSINNSAGRIPSAFTIHNSQLIFLILAGLFAGLAHLSRADGLLLLITIILVYLLRLTVAKTSLPRTTYHVLRVILFLLFGYFIVMAPWFIRNWQAIGTPLPASGAQSIWLTNYDDLFSYGRELSPQTFFAQGIGPILQGRWWVLTTNLQTVLAVWGMIFLLPLAAAGFWILRQHLLIQLAAMYALLLFLVMTLVFAFPGARGGLFHSGTALLPYICAAAVVGLDRGVDWVAARRRGWNAKFAKQFFAVGLVIMAILLSVFLYYQRVLKNDAWNRADRSYATIAEWVSEQNLSAIVMINNPPAYRYHGGGLSVVVPNENIDTTLQAARRYQVDYLILGSNDPALADIYHQTIDHPQLLFVKAVGNTKIFEIVAP